MAIVIEFPRRQPIDTAPCEIDPVDWTPPAGLFAGRPPRGKPTLVLPRTDRRIVTDDDFHGGGDAA